MYHKYIMHKYIACISKGEALSSIKCKQYQVLGSQSPARNVPGTESRGLVRRLGGVCTKINEGFGVGSHAISTMTDSWEFRRTRFGKAKTSGEKCA